MGFGFGDARFRQVDGFIFDIDGKVFFGQTNGELIGQHVGLGRVLFPAGNDERRPRFIDQDWVDFIDDRKIQRSLYDGFFVNDHVVAQIIESEFVVGRIQDIGIVGFPFLFGGQFSDIQTNR